MIIYKLKIDVTLLICAVLCSCLPSIVGRRVKRVIGGTEVECGSQIQISSLRNASNTQHLCGATILTPEWAITAAHCVHYEPEQYILQLNNHCINDTGTFPKAQIVQIMHHPLYNRYTRAHDIALLHITLDFHDRKFKNIILPSSSFGVTGVCRIYGYGIRNLNRNELSDKLLTASMQIISLDECYRILGPRMAPDYKSGMMCAADDTFDSCQGDSGGPLICGDSRIEAISSHGLTCGVSGIPGIYTSIGAHLSWIRGVINSINQECP